MPEPTFGPAGPGTGPGGRGSAGTEHLDGRWTPDSRCQRRARVTRFTRVTPTGTVRIRFEVVDDRPFSMRPGQFVGIELGAEDLGYRRSPYCLLPPPEEERSFELLVRVVSTGTVSRYLGSRSVGDVVAFRGPTGRSMVPVDTDRELVMMVTGVGLSPVYFLASQLLSEGYARPIRLYWGLRQPDDLCLIDELDDLVRRHPSFSYHVSLSQPPARWDGLRGRLTESVPPLLTTLEKKQFYLVGNGAMTEEVFAALSDMGVAKQHIHHESYFNRRYRPDPETLRAIRDRFTDGTPSSPFAIDEGSLFHLDRPLNAPPERQG